MLKNKENEVMNYPIVFKSPGHQRYENDVPVMGLQSGCVRTIRIEENVNGCSGYDIEPGRGYIIKVFNNDTGTANMSDKPMDLISADSNKIVFRGYWLNAMSPFGWQNVDYSCYGFVVYLNNNEIEKCSLYMYDRDIRIDYLSDKELKKLMAKEDSSEKAKFEDIAADKPFSFEFAKIYVQYFWARAERGRSMVIMEDLPNSEKGSVIERTEDGKIIVRLARLELFKERKGIELPKEIIMNSTFEQTESEYAPECMSAKSKDCVFENIEIFRKRGCVFSFITMPVPNDARGAYYLIELDNQK